MSKDVHVVFKPSVTIEGLMAYFSKNADINCKNKPNGHNLEKLEISNSAKEKALIWQSNQGHITYKQDELKIVVSYSILNEKLLKLNYPDLDGFSTNKNDAYIVALFDREQIHNDFINSIISDLNGFVLLDESYTHEMEI